MHKIILGDFKNLGVTMHTGGSSFFDRSKFFFLQWLLGFLISPTIMAICTH